MDKASLFTLIEDHAKVLKATPLETPREQIDLLSSYLPLTHTIIITGLRRCGKSTLLKQLIQRHNLSNQIYYLNFEDERLINFTVLDFDTLYQCFLELYGERKIFCFDEIQNIPEWERFIRRMHDWKIKSIITGSNASLLSKELGTKLTGRNIPFELYPFSFREYLSHKKIEFKQKKFYSTPEKALFIKNFKIYLKNGGLPEYLKENNKMILQTIYDDILYRDIIIRYEIKDIKALRKLGFYLLSNIASLYSYNNLLKILPIGSISTLRNYIEYLENCYLFFSVERFSFSIKQQEVSPRKIYAIDNGIINAIGFQLSPNIGKLLENLVFIELKRRRHQTQYEIYYYKTEHNLEVDFLIRHGNEITQLIQVTENLSDPKTKNREIKALLEAMHETQCNNALILTVEESEKIEVKNYTITVMPIYQWLLNL